MAAAWEWQEQQLPVQIHKRISIGGQQQPSDSWRGKQGACMHAPEQCAWGTMLDCPGPAACASPQPCNSTAVHLLQVLNLPTILTIGRVVAIPFLIAGPCVSAHQRAEPPCFLSHAAFLLHAGIPVPHSICFCACALSWGI